MPQDRRNLFVWISGVVFILALLINLGLINPFPGWIVLGAKQVIRPMQVLVRGAHRKIEIFFTFSAQIKEVGNLRREVADLHSENLRLHAVEEENLRLRQLLGIAETLSYEKIAAEIISRDPLGVTRGATINRGADEGVTEDSAVLDEHGNFVGIVEKVYPSSSHILFITDGTFKVDASILGREAVGLAQGSHGVGMEVNLLSQESVVEHNDVVVTAGITEKIPKGLAIGVVDELLSSETELFKRVSLVPYADTQSLDFVLIVKYQRNPSP